MGIQYCKSFLLEQLQAIHDFSGDTFKIALFDNSASFDDETTAYSTTNEIVVTGYTAGGEELTLSSGYPQIESGAAAVRWDSVTWTFSGNATIRWALIYNSSKANRSVLSVDFAGPRIYMSTFVVEFPSLSPPIINIRAPNVS